MVHCTASIAYDENSMTRMVRTRMRSFRGPATYGLFVIGLGLIIVGVLTSYSTVATRTMMIAIGCFMIVGVNSPEKYMAKKVIQSMNGSFPKLSYDFSLSTIKIKGADHLNRLEYDSIIRLVEDPEYLYLFLADKSAIMVDCSTIKPKKEHLKELLSEKTGLTWTKPHSLINTSLLSIIKDRKNTKKVKTAGKKSH